jgi:predicted transcriptional regulator
VRGVSFFIETAPHEFGANYLFDGGDDYSGLQPYFACDSIIKRHDGSHVVKFEVDGETWVAKLYYQDSGIVHPGKRTPTGTEFSIQTLREFRIHVFRHPDEDPVGEQKFNCHIAPRWQGMQVENDDGEISSYSVPDAITEAINVSVKGANIEFDRYQHLLQRAASALDLNPRYVRDPHEYSNIQDAERYVRLHKDRSDPIHARDGPIASMAHLLENDRDGYRKLVQNERDEHGRHLPGYYHTVTLGPRRIQEAFPSHQLPKENKHYYAREAYQHPDDHPLAHPKLGASYQANRWDETLGVEPDDIAQLNRELEETVLSTLADAGIPIRPAHADDADELARGPYVPDAYFDAAENDRDDVSLVSLDLTEIRSDQESVVIKHLADGLSPVEWESLEMLVTDGGTVSPQDIADEYGRHIDSVRRALNRLPDLIEHDYGNVKLRSKHIADYVYDAVKQAKDATRRAVEATAKAAEASERGVDESTSAFIAFCAKHGIDVDDRHDAQL